MTVSIRPDDPNKEFNAPLHPAITLGDALKLGYSKKTYGKGEVVWQSVINDAMPLGTPPGLREPTPTHGAIISEDAISNGEATFASGIEDDIVPVLDDAQRTCDEDVAPVLRQLAEPQEKVAPRGSKQARTLNGHVLERDRLQAVIDADQKCNIPIHEPVPAAVATFAPLAPALETVGAGFFVSKFLDVSIFDPMQDLTAWVMSFIVVVATVVGQWALMTLAGKSHNQAREAAVRGNRYEADRGRTRRRRYIILSAATVTLALTVGLILRGEDALVDADAKSIAFMALIAFMAGVVPPSLTFLANALNGSSASRERDALNAYLEDDLAHFRAEVEDAEVKLTEVESLLITVTEDLVPGIVDRALEDVREADRFNDLVRLMIGGLVGNPPAQSEAVVIRKTDGTVSARITTYIPGSRSVDLGPLGPRNAWMLLIRARVEDLRNQLMQLPPHPQAPSA